MVLCELTAVGICDHSRLEVLNSGIIGFKVVNFLSWVRSLFNMDMKSLFLFVGLVLLISLCSAAVIGNDGWPDNFKGQVMLSGPKNFNPLTKGGKWPENDDERKKLMERLGIGKSTTVAATDGWPHNFKGQVMLSGPKDFNPFTKGGSWPQDEEAKKKLMIKLGLWKDRN